MPARLLFPLLALCLFQAGIPAAGTPPQDAALTLDFLVTDREGNTPLDLGPADVELKIGGKAQRLLSLDLIALDESGRNIMLLVAEPTLHALEPIARDAVTKLLDSVGPADRITYAATRTNRGGPVVRGAAAVSKALTSMVTGPGVLYSCLTDTLRNVGNLAQRLPRGRTSTLAVIARGHPEGATYGSEGDRAPCTPSREGMREVADIVAAAQINLYYFTVSETRRSLGFETLAANTGGTAGLLTFADNDDLAAAVTGSRHMYRAVFAADQKANDRPQRVQLRVNRQGHHVTTSAALVLRRASAPRKNP